MREILSWKIEFSSSATDHIVKNGFTNLSDCTDAQLIELVLSGEKSAYEVIFERYKRLAAVIAARYFQQPDQIEEVIQMTFIKVYFELKNFRGDYNHALNSWLGKITTNVCFDLLRKQKRGVAIPPTELTDDEKDFLFAGDEIEGNNSETSLINRDLAEKLLSKLAAEDQALLQMLYAEELSVKEISELTGWSGSKIRVRAFRARLVLQKFLKRLL